MLCSVCKKNTAIIFVNKQDEKGEQSLEGFCYNCAKEKGINPLDVLAKQSTVLEGDSVNLEDMTAQFETIFKDLTENLSTEDIRLDSATAIPFNALFIGTNGKILNHFTNIIPNKIQPPVFGAKYTVEYLGEPVFIKEDDIIEIILET